MPSHGHDRNNPRQHPAIKALDPRGLGVRDIAYHRRDSASSPEPYISQQVYDTPTRATNNGLEITAGAIEGFAVALVGGGLAARIHPGAVGRGAAPGLLVGIQPAIWSANDEVADTERIEFNQVAINRIGVTAGSVARELSQ
ncbi:hypothetical protein D3C84_559130 [compost metagenome]